MKSKSRCKSCWALAALAVTSFVAKQTCAEVSLNAFGDLNYGYRFGSAADVQARTLFDSFGEDVAPKSSHSGFGLVGTDFVVTAELPADIVYLGEINFQVERGNQSEFEVDVERMFLEKRFTQAFNLQGGLFFTPVGYFNRTLYSRAFLMVSGQVPDLFEEELGIVPTHTVGLHAHGEFELGGEHRLGYSVSVGNGRAANPVSNVYARDDDGWRSVTALAEWFAPWGKELRLGASAWYDRITSYQVGQLGERREPADPTTQGMKLHELGFDAHFVLKSRWVNLILEGVFQRHKDRAHGLPLGSSNTHLWAGLGELSLNLGSEGRLKPYLRYDGIDLPNSGGPYLQLRSSEEVLTRVYVPESSLGILGVSWDAALSWRLKLEYSEALAGPREKHGVLVQSAFAF